MALIYQLLFFRLYIIRCLQTIAIFAKIYPLLLERELTKKVKHCTLN